MKWAAMERNGKKKWKKAGVLTAVFFCLLWGRAVLEAGAVTTPASDFVMQGNKLVEYTGSDTTVWIPDTVRVIGTDAFRNCENLYRVALPDKLKKIESGAFSGCETLRYLTLPDSVTEIGFGAFLGCKNLKKVSFGESLSKLGYGAFGGCENLDSVDLAKNSRYVCRYGVLYDRNQTRVYQMLAGSPYSKYTMPQSVKQIAPYAFMGCGNLKYVELSGSLTEIPAYAFAECVSLEGITIPEGVGAIGVRAFMNCTKLREAAVPDSVTYIQRTAFQGSALEELYAQEEERAEETEGRTAEETAGE